MSSGLFGLASRSREASPFFDSGSMLTVVYISFVLMLLAVATYVDLRWRIVPNSIPLLIIVATLLLAAWTKVLGDWQLWCGYLVAALLGIVISSGLGFGGGDGKLITSLGGIFGPIGVIQCVCWMAIAGLGLALAAKWRRKKDYAYVPAIMCGVVVQLAIQQRWFSQ